MKTKKLVATPSDMEKIDSIKSEIDGLNSTLRRWVDFLDSKKQKLSSLYCELESLSAESDANVDLPLGTSVRIPVSVVYECIMKEVYVIHGSLENIRKAEELKNGKD